MSFMFLLSGRIAVILLIVAGLTGLFGKILRKVLKASLVMKIHKYSGIGAIASGLVHGFIYFVFFH